MTTGKSNWRWRHGLAGRLGLLGLLLSLLLSLPGCGIGHGGSHSDTSTRGAGGHSDMHRH